MTPLKMRFQFTGGGTGDLDDRIDLDQITVTTVSGGGSTSTVVMVDDGLHGDGAASDHVYGGQVPAQALGTTVSYYVNATDDSGFTTADPATAPTDKYSYTVGSASQLYTMAALPDTGQVASLSTLPGEDSDYAVNPPTYKDNGDGTVTDQVTGLMWQQVDGGEMTWEQAAAYAESLTLGGYSDWRLPFSKELFSLMDEGTITQLF